MAQFLGVGVLGASNTPGDATKAISGLGQPVVVTLFGLFIITRCLDRTGVTRWIARRILGIGGKSGGRVICPVSGGTALSPRGMNKLRRRALLPPELADQ